MAYVNDTKPSASALTWTTITTTWAAELESWAGSGGYTNDTKPS